jgi:hypothetical protein
MGCWGYEDDATDQTWDAISEFEKSIETEQMSKLQKQIQEDEKENTVTTSRKTVIGRSEKGVKWQTQLTKMTRSSIMKHPEKLAKFMKHLQKKGNWSEVVGLGLHFARKWRGNGLFEALNKENSDQINVPRHLPPNTPVALKRLCIKAIRRLLKDQDRINSFDQPKLREEALLKELELFQQ